ncbi:MAG: hypothetical protein GWN37_06080, partial [Gammaproteobacteria bacterium]|nr:hypothetical protein [Gammaproteobacteria bacterium]
MDRALAIQILAFEAEAAAGEAPAGSHPAPASWRDPMAPDLAYLKALDRLVAAEIASRLEHRPMLMGNVAALRSLERCIHTHLEPCVVLLHRATHWYELATANPRMLDETRAILLLGLAKLYAFSGETD